MSQTLADRMSEVQDLIEVVAEVAGVLNKLAALDPVQRDEDGSRCFFCKGGKHADDCLWLHARALIKGEE